MWNQWPRTRSPSELMQADAFLPKSLGNLHSGKISKRTNRANSPTIQRFQNLRRRRQNIERKILKPLRFSAAANYSNARKATGRRDRCIRIRCNSDMGLYAGGAHVCGNFFRNFRIRSEQPLQSFQIKYNRTWRCVFHAWRECAGAIGQCGVRFT